MDQPAALLISLEVGEEERRALAEVLPDIPWTPIDPGHGVAGREARALLVGNARLELVGWSSSLSPKLELVQCAHTGLDRFPFELFPDPIRVAGNGGAYAPFVAERALALILALGHHVTANLAAVREGRLRPAMENQFLAGANVLILGYGEIGRELSGRLAACGAEVSAVSRTGGNESGVARMSPARELVEAVRTADVVLDCRPLTAATRGTIDRAAFAAMKPTARFVNVGRAGTVDEAALYERLVSVPTFSAALDVWWDEQYATGQVSSRFPFAQLPNFLGTPHNAGLGPGSWERGIRWALRNLRRFFDGDTVRYVADRAEYA
ncbi:MAG: hypothetical protein L3K17_07390 [Thermoplasmata archaeon]|nr:hypothetical protein [Thermoplasmata archaeon]